MCWEELGIAFCAHPNPPALTFTCGKLHIIAATRLLCDKVKGPCVCFFGTCGIIEKIDSGAGIDLTAISKVRCASCTTREDVVGDRRHGRELIESPLLTRSPVEAYEYVEYMRTLRSLWGDKELCPYHQPKETVAHTQESKAEENHLNDAHGTDEANGKAEDERDKIAETQDMEQIGRQVSPMNQNQSTSASPTSIQKQDSRTSSRSDKPNRSNSKTPDKQPIKPNIGIETSRWAPNGEARQDNQPVVAPRPIVPPPTVPKTAIHIPQIGAMKDFLRGR